MDREADRAGRDEKARVIRKKDVGVDSERSGEVDGVNAEHMGQAGVPPR